MKNASWDEMRSLWKVVSSSFDRFQIPLDEKADLRIALDVAKARLDLPEGSKVLLPWTPEKMAWALSVVCRLGDNLRRLENGGLDASAHLRGMADGNARYGRKDGNEDHEFKDWEFELYVAATLTSTSKVIELHKPGAPFDITLEKLLQIECKHPSSPKKVASYITDFGKALEGRPGVLIIGVEDVLDLWDMGYMGPRDNYRDIVKQRFARVNRDHGSGWEKNLRTHPSILGLIFSSSGMMYYKDDDGREKYAFQALWTQTPFNGKVTVETERVRDLLLAAFEANTESP